MHEVELKLQIPTDQFNALNKAFLTKTTQKIDLHARYFDTQDSALAQHLMAIRIRKEGAHWIQTFKSAGKSHLQRFEHELDLGTALEAPNLDLEIYQQYPQALALLNQALGDNWQQLELQFETIVQRHYRIIHLNGSKIEVCLDLGTLKSQQQQRSIQEVEFELKSGQLTDLIQITAQWVKRYHLWLDVRSKAERGHLLAHDKVVSDATLAKPYQLDPNVHPENALKVIIAQSLEHILPNVAAIAEQVATIQHIQQAKISIQQLYHVLKHFAHWSHHKLTVWEKQLKALASQLEQANNEEIFHQQILPKIQQAGVQFKLEKSDYTQLLSRIFQDPLTTKLWLELLDFAYTQNQNATSKSNLHKKAVKILQPLEHQAVKKVNQYQTLEPKQKQSLSQHITALTHIFSAVSSLYPAKAAQIYYTKLTATQAQLEKYRQLRWAKKWLKTQTQNQAVLSWLDAQQNKRDQKIIKKLRRLAKNHPF
ncbi:CYTH domain-containing protein [Acinetobacter sp. MD2]|uniref:CYTH domain-containing protein n=1 Tax=Acinetobacter sp. MD2 TaxID=2600066 RepID=UPI002D1F18DB|nr:CYTH domain-containing protein [Acinetobacter sp. MD2]MEB3766179.1 CYTH domain-containing protein [Acinetobacter sp. MD2]